MEIKVRIWDIVQGEYVNRPQIIQTVKMTYPLLPPIGSILTFDGRSHRVTNIHFVTPRYDETVGETEIVLDAKREWDDEDFPG